MARRQDFPSNTTRTSSHKIDALCEFEAPQFIDFTSLAEQNQSDFSSWFSVTHELHYREGLEKRKLELAASQVARKSTPRSRKRFTPKKRLPALSDLATSASEQQSTVAVISVGPPAKTPEVKKRLFASPAAPTTIERHPTLSPALQVQMDALSLDSPAPTKTARSLFSTTASAATTKNVKRKQTAAARGSTNTRALKRSALGSGAARVALSPIRVDNNKKKKKRVRVSNAAAVAAAAAPLPNNNSRVHNTSGDLLLTKIAPASSNQRSRKKYAKTNSARSAGGAAVGAQRKRPVVKSDPAMAAAAAKRKKMSAADMVAQISKWEKVSGRKWYTLSQRQKTRILVKLNNKENL